MKLFSFFLLLIPWVADRLFCLVVVNTERSRSASEFIFSTLCIYRHVVCSSLLYQLAQVQLTIMSAENSAEACIERQLQSGLYIKRVTRYGYYLLQRLDPC